MMLALAVQAYTRVTKLLDKILVSRITRTDPQQLSAALLQALLKETKHILIARIIYCG
ncbi:hypothetical protein NDI49_07100 [Trichocoleus sp. ST-U3]|uniref:hypothetical protein n=1 Tax=Coleofasciculus sp. FACHB-542 TaxID=2692787 RepID=UPI001686D3CB|nr:hypothetical protein [Coleofasciculus sp. FACHB-542]MBD2087690.1 hypothetical protein [Coleofasciculus sp. FACHB-542]